MALDKATLKTAIENALAAAHGKGVQAADSTLAQTLADAIDTFVKTGTPTGTAGGDPLVGGAIS